MSEMRTLREELINRKTVTSVEERNKSIIPDQSSGDRQPEGRLSFAFQMAASASKLSNISSSNSNAQQSGQQNSGDGDSVQTPTTSKPSLLRGLSFRLSGKESRLFPPRNQSVKLPSTREGKKMEAFLRRTSYPDPKEPFDRGIALLIQISFVISYNHFSQQNYKRKARLRHSLSQNCSENQPSTLREVLKRE